MLKPCEGVVRAANLCSVTEFSFEQAPVTTEFQAYFIYSLFQLNKPLY